MILFFLLLFDPSSFLHSRAPGGELPRDHAPSASFATAIPDRGPLFVSNDPDDPDDSDDPAEVADCGESAAAIEPRRLGPVPAPQIAEDPRRGGYVAWWPRAPSRLARSCR
jgi:hypothetical protein